MKLINKILSEMEEDRKLVVDRPASEPLQSESEIHISHEPLTKRPRGRPPIVEDKKFIKLWNEAAENGTDLNVLAVDLGIAPTSASVRASLLRKKGVTLKQFRRGRRKKA